MILSTYNPPSKSHGGFLWLVVGAWWRGYNSPSRSNSHHAGNNTARTAHHNIVKITPPITTTICSASFSGLNILCFAACACRFMAWIHLQYLSLYQYPCVSNCLPHNGHCPLISVLGSDFMPHPPQISSNNSGNFALSSANSGFAISCICG